MSNDKELAEEMLQQSSEQSRAMTPAAGSQDERTSLKEAIREANE